MTLHLLTDILRNSILITGLVTIMMMLIESIDLESHGHFFKGLKTTRAGQVVVSSLLGLIPGCIGGFAAVSLYTQRIIGFGALVAMMIASTGDEAFMMLAMMPGKALWLFLLLFVIAVACGIVIDLAGTRIRLFRRPEGKWSQTRTDGMNAESIILQEHAYIHTHSHHCSCGSHVENILHGDTNRNIGNRNGNNGSCGNESIGTSATKRHWGWKRATMLAGVLIFIAALVTGLLDHGHHAHEHATEGAAALAGMNLLDEKWMNFLFAALCIILVAVLFKASDRFVETSLWEHIVKRHVPVIFAWTFGILAVVAIGMSYIDISGWISQNTPLMILLAVAIGLIPESGPHMIFVTLYASGIVPLPVLLASCISQDGHSSLPLLAEDKKSFAAAKLINCAIALLAGFGSLLVIG